jgi:uncharacterized membrane protein HdeD (DUF308 family)
MAKTVAGDVGDRLGVVGRSWGWILTFGILTLIAGVLALVWPRETLLFIALLFGAQLIVEGVFRFVEALSAPRESSLPWVLPALLAILSFIVGIYLLRHPFFTILILAVLLGIYWMVHGITETFSAIAHRERPNRGLTAASGVLGIVAGGIVLFYPGLSLLVLALILGIWLILFGLLSIAQAFRLRTGARARRPTVAAG